VRIRESLLARRDIDQLYRYGIENFGEPIADAYVARLLNVFEFIARHPALARERSDISPPVRMHPHESHLVVYRSSPDEVEIVRVLPARADWVNRLKPDA